MGSEPERPVIDTILTLEEETMAAIEISAPGTEHGPCSRDCQHRDCALSRKQAGSPCRLCGKLIGYETAFYVDPEGAGKLVHALCLEIEVEKVP